jgi:acetyl-CoA carboxylase biotin carboxyl carrier protein
MSTQEIQELIDFIAKSGLDEVKIETSELKINVKRTATPAMVTMAAPMPAPASLPAAPPASAAAPAAPAAAPAAPPAASATNQITIKSPMIGTFYRSANPESPLFAEVGDEIKPGKVVCIIEAMKLFNEIEAEISGRIVKVLVENATPVEYDQPLFIVEEI